MRTSRAGSWPCPRDAPPRRSRTASSDIRHTEHSTASAGPVIVRRYEPAGPARRADRQIHPDGAMRARTPPGGVTLMTVPWPVRSMVAGAAGTTALTLAYAAERKLRKTHRGQLDHDDSIVPGQIVASV